MNFDYDEIFDTEQFYPYPPLYTLIYFILIMVSLIAISNIVTIVKKIIELIKNPQENI